MNKETLKNLVKSYFQLEEKQISENITKPATELKFDEATLVDGTKVTNMIEEPFAVGQELHVILEDGTHVIAPEGSHDTESGISLVVDQGGKITGVHRPDSDGAGSLAEDDINIEMAKEDSSDVKTELAEDEVDIEMDETIIEAIMTEIAPMIEEMKKKMEEVEIILADHSEKMKEYMSSPAEQPTSESRFAKANKSVKEHKAVFNVKRYESALSRITNK